MSVNNKGFRTNEKFRYLDRLVKKNLTDVATLEEAIAALPSTEDELGLITDSGATVVAYGVTYNNEPETYGYQLSGDDCAALFANDNFEITDSADWTLITAAQAAALTAASLGSLNADYYYFGAAWQTPGSVVVVRDGATSNIIAGNFNDGTNWTADAFGTGSWEPGVDAVPGGLGDVTNLVILKYTGAGDPGASVTLNSVSHPVVSEVSGYFVFLRAQPTIRTGGRKRLVEDSSSDPTTYAWELIPDAPSQVFQSNDVVELWVDLDEGNDTTGDGDRLTPYATLGGAMTDRLGATDTNQYLLRVRGTGTDSSYVSTGFTINASSTAKVTILGEGGSNLGYGPVVALTSNIQTSQSHFVIKNMTLTNGGGTVRALGIGGLTVINSSLATLFVADSNVSLYRSRVLAITGGAGAQMIVTSYDTVLRDITLASNAIGTILNAYGGRMEPGAVITNPATSNVPAQFNLYAGFIAADIDIDNDLPAGDPQGGFVLAINPGSLFDYTSIGTEAPNPTVDNKSIATVA